jgi:hypothetical protein
MADQEDRMQLRVQWDNVEAVPLQYANRFAVQSTPTELVIIVGQVSIPFFIGTPDEQRAFIESQGGVKVRPLARYAVSRQAAAELLEFLQAQIAKLDAQPLEDDTGQRRS